MNLYKINLLDIRFISARVTHTLPCSATGWIGNRVFKVFLESSMNGKMHSIKKVAELSGYAADITPGTGRATFNFLSPVTAFSFYSPGNKGMNFKRHI
jgi:hypothetical protein